MSFHQIGLFTILKGLPVQLTFCYSAPRCKLGPFHSTITLELKQKNTTLKIAEKETLPSKLSDKAALEREAPLQVRMKGSREKNLKSLVIGLSLTSVILPQSDIDRKLPC